MRAIEEYNLTGITTGKVTLYPENNKNLNYKKIITGQLESYQQRKKENSVWDNYNKYIKESIQKNNLKINLKNLNQKLDKLDEMKKDQKNYIQDDINKIIDEINKIYKEIIEDINKQIKDN